MTWIQTCIEFQMWIQIRYSTMIPTALHYQVFVICWGKFFQESDLLSIIIRDAAQHFLEQSTVIFSFEGHHLEELDNIDASSQEHDEVPDCFRLKDLDWLLDLDLKSVAKAYLA